MTLSNRMLILNKYHGTGNDFILIEEPIDPSRVPALCHRRYGVGADGVLCLIDKRLIIYNADGSRPAMCGNGLRCAATHYLEKHGGESVDIETDAGTYHCKNRSVLMPTPVDLPWEGEGRLIDSGVPHLVVEHFENPARLRRLADANVTYMESAGATIRARTYERGVEAETLSCGTGALAVAYASGLARLTVCYPEAALELERTSCGYWLTGPVTHVFSTTALSTE
ncbi:MAG: hypothetical protein MRY21_06865 [Simkaniaceae bacterium]|nr:hypothetical protein [Simkaniaceae bacterium]